jgi:hypothetical protein
LAFAQQAVTAAAAVHTADKSQDAFRMARAYRLLGDVERERGQSDDARKAWISGLRLIPAGRSEQPDELAEHAALLQRLERSGDAQPLAAKLRSMGYRLPV